tara:strand:+ start:1238 stop:1777 length:540 start_codon:yes stop_codon:yes gene_type:complete
MKPINWVGHYHRHYTGMGERVFWEPFKEPRNPDDKYLKEKNAYLYTTTTNYFLAKTVEYSTKEKFLMDAENLERLKEEKFESVEVPEFHFETLSNNTIRYTCQFIKGRVVTPTDMNKLYQELVLRDSDYSFCDYSIANFIQARYHQLDGKIFSVDLNAYKKVPVEDRMILWERYKLQSW